MNITDHNLLTVLESLTLAEREAVEDCARATRCTTSETIDRLRAEALRKIRARLKRKARSRPEPKFRWLN